MCVPTLSFSLLFTHDGIHVYRPAFSAGLPEKGQVRMFYHHFFERVNQFGVDCYSIHGGGQVTVLSVTQTAHHM